jgi:hypothetical protein
MEGHVGPSWLTSPMPTRTTVVIDDAACTHTQPSLATAAACEADPSIAASRRFRNVVATYLAGLLTTASTCPR